MRRAVLNQLQVSNFTTSTNYCSQCNACKYILILLESKGPKKPNSNDPTKEKSDDCKQSETHELSSTADHKSPNEFWIESLGLFEHDRHVLLSTQWLNDNIISAAQELLKLSVPDGLEIGGLQSPQCGRHLKFKPVVPREKYIQVLHVDDNHWITVSNIDVGKALL